MTGWQLVTIGLAEYAESSWNVPEAGQCRRSVADLLLRHGAEVEDWTPRATREHRDQALEEWAERLERPQLLYWVGHGEHSDDGYRIALADSTEPLTGLNAVRGTQLFEALRDQRRHRGDDYPDCWSLLILDTCGSGEAAKVLWGALLRANPRNVGVIATTDDGAAFAGRFPQDLARALNGFTGNDTGGIELRELLRRLENLWESTARGPRVHHFFDSLAVIPLADTDQQVQAPVDTYAELRDVLADTSPDIRNHFYAKAQGAEIGEPAWFFTGRVAERRTVTTWLRDAPGGMFVVSGIAGSGKSALLGMLLASSDQAVRTALQAAGQAPIPPDLRPADQAFDAVVHLSGRTIGDSVAILAAGLDLLGVEDPDQDTFIGCVADRPGGHRLTVMADALDEARDPLLIATLLRRLASLTGVRVLIGTRQSLNEGPDNPTPSDSVVLDTLAAPADQVIKLERDPDAVLRYTRDRLAAKLPTPLIDRIDDLAGVIATYDQPFLFARLAVHEITAAPEWVTPGSDLDQLLGSGHSGIFGHTVARLGRDAPKVEALLHVLTYARGNGFPRTDGIWATAASAVVDTPITDTDVEQALSLAAPYILQDTESGQGVYRLAHRTFAEWYLRSDTP